MGGHIEGSLARHLLPKDGSLGQPLEALSGLQLGCSSFFLTVLNGDYTRGAILYVGAVIVLTVIGITIIVVGTKIPVKDC